jgi:hypothetical protein
VPYENCAQVNKSSCLNPRDTIKMRDERNSPYEISLLFFLYAIHATINIENRAMRYDDISSIPK